MRRKGLFLNGKPVKVKGTCNHQDHAGLGAALPDAVQYYRMRKLQEMGSNATAHLAQSAYARSCSMPATIWAFWCLTRRA